MTYDLKKHLTKKHIISAIMAIVAVIILAIPSENNSYTECGVGSVYSHGECRMTTGGAIKLTGAFIVFFYLSLLVLERREKEDELEAESDQKITKSKKLNNESDDDIQRKIDDSFNHSSENEDDYKNIPF